MALQFPPTVSSPSSMSSHVQANAYALGDTVIYKNIIVKANAAIPANTVFAWGTTGATWSPVVGPGYNWRGLWLAANSYAIDDVTVGSTTANILYAATAAMTPAAFNDPVAGANRHNWFPIAGIPQTVKPATSTTGGQAGLVLPTGGFGFQNRTLTGAGDWMKSVSIYDSTRNYQSGDYIMYGGYLAILQTGTAAGTAFSWANWVPVTTFTGYTWRGIYNAATTYALNDVVSESATGSLWISRRIAAQSGNTPAVGSQVWAPFSTMGREPAFIGATASVAGTLGTVPAPLAADAGKVLGADGTWRMPARPYVSGMIVSPDDLVYSANILWQYVGVTTTTITVAPTLSTTILWVPMSTHMIIVEYAAQSITTATTTPLSGTIAATLVSAPGFTGSASGITLPAIGFYEVSAAILWAANATGYRKMQLRSSGSVVQTDSQLAVAALEVVTTYTHRIIKTNANNQNLDVTFYQNSGANLNGTLRLTAKFLHI